MVSYSREETDFKAWCLLAQNPRLSQREKSPVLSISLDKINFYLKVLIGESLDKVQHFRKNQNKLTHTYLLTPWA
ncbi:hypothetical protein HC248_00270 [Polaromonas vacuolata]|uniref:Uncharacterized protein n=1 Tax=Polaromonas vacuolata TaxID=37448 RepID=A0A6H2H5G3_9BURK|nr:hypothetical protein HC248_00270 [Polaromonas vacuolata]